MEQKNFEYTEKKYDGEMMNNGCCYNNFEYMAQPSMIGQSNMMCQPIYECPQERICHRYMCYEVPHIMPCNTKIINHHIYRHTYEPCYTTCEENVVSNVYDKNCCF